MTVYSPSPILITGVGKRLGLALAQHFLIQDIPVIGTFRTDYPVLSELKLSGAELYQCDFYDQVSVNKFIASVMAQHGSLRAIIHNASDWIPESEDFEAAQVMEKMMQVHVSVPYQINLALKELLLSSPENLKDIIHFTDFVADKGSKKHIAYAASKAALANMTLSFAASLAPLVKVNSIAPALVLFNDRDNDEYKAKAVKKALIEKEGGLREVISSVDYLLSSTYITGRTLHLDGGRHLK
ncbi:MAG: dihydromonapterin reductase/dihydrofolate reductase [Oleiphilaceae bacterium]|jgi:dihydromonapterin reductase/dihydrofolate reductase